MTEPAEADLVVVARVVGLVDQSPGAQNRRTREVHTVLVERTLQGCDESGLSLVVRPNGEDWETGRSYVLFLKRAGLKLLEAVPGTSRPASSAAESEVRRTLGSPTVGPQRLLWVQHEAGWGAGVQSEFWMTADGRYEWVSGQDKARRGRMPADVKAALLDRVQGAGPGPQADDAGVVTFRVIGPTEKLQFHTYTVPDSPPASDLLREIRELALKHHNANVEDKS